MRFISVGRGHQWTLKRTVFDQVGIDIYTGVGLFPPRATYHVGDLDALKQIFSFRGAFKKHQIDYRMLTVFGPNLVSSEGDVWKRQRRIVAPVFSERNNRLVQSAAMGFVDEMIASWNQGEPTHIDEVDNNLTMQIALCVIAKAGFGQEFKWGDDGEATEGHDLTFKQALLTVSSNLLKIIVLPKWAFGLRKDWVAVKKAYNELRQYFHELILLRRAEHGSAIEERHDLFNQLIHAHADDDTLSEEELIGNVFLFLFAGHETTAHSLAFALGLLAIYPNEQRKLVQQIQDLQLADKDFTYDDLPKFTYALAVLYETLRLYPIALALPRRSAMDTTLTCTPHGQKEAVSVPIREGARAIIHVPGVHYNPKYWDDPADFVPARFLDPNWNRDAFIPFLSGPRACIGRRFAETTAVTVLVRLLSKYQVSVDETKFKMIEGEPIIQLRERLLSARLKTTLTPGRIPLVFTPRS